MKIRIKAKVVPQPCTFRERCQGACDWCKTHDYSEACVPMLQEEIKLLTGSLPRYSLEELAPKICNSFTAEECDKCPAELYCRPGHNGMLEWLRKVVRNG